MPNTEALRRAFADAPEDCEPLRPDDCRRVWLGLSDRAANAGGDVLQALEHFRETGEGDVRHLVGQWSGLHTLRVAGRRCVVLWAGDDLRLLAVGSTGLLGDRLPLTAR